LDGVPGCGQKRLAEMLTSHLQGGVLKAVEDGVLTSWRSQRAA
jgi:hypothetical protein